MNNKEQFEFRKKHGLPVNETAEDRVKSLVNMLIKALYIPVKEHILTKLDPERAKSLFINTLEPINWWDLKCREVRFYEPYNMYAVTVDEAGPDECPSLCEYIEAYMKSYGWEVFVKTEW